MVGLSFLFKSFYHFLKFSFCPPSARRFDGEYPLINLIVPADSHFFPLTFAEEKTGVGLDDAAFVGPVSPNLSFDIQDHGELGLRPPQPV